MRLIFLDAARKSERSKDSSSDFNKRSEYFGPKVTLTGFLTLFAALVGGTGVFFVFFHNVNVFYRTRNSLNNTKILFYTWLISKVPLFASAVLKNYKNHKNDKNNFLGCLVSTGLIESISVFIVFQHHAVNRLFRKFREFRVRN